MKRSGFTLEQIAHVTKHKNLDSLKHYVDAPTLEEKESYKEGYSTMAITIRKPHQKDQVTTLNQSQTRCQLLLTKKIMTIIHQITEKLLCQTEMRSPNPHRITALIYRTSWPTNCTRHPICSKMPTFPTVTLISHYPSKLMIQWTLHIYQKNNYFWHFNSPGWVENITVITTLGEHPCIFLQKFLLLSNIIIIKLLQFIVFWNK